MSDQTPPYPYEIHTNRELKLIAAGKKPLAVFAHERIAGFEKFDALAGQDFSPLLAEGIVSEQVRTFQSSDRTGKPVEIDYYFYATKGEEWRVEAYVLILRLLYRGEWCPQLEWLQGTLLGYTDEQNEYHVSRVYGARAQDPNDHAPPL